MSNDDNNPSIGTDTLVPLTRGPDGLLGVRVSRPRNYGGNQDGARSNKTDSSGGSPRTMR